MKRASKSIPLAMLTLAACASSPDLQVASSGSLPLTGTYRFTRTETQPQFEAIVSEHLDGAGFAKADQPQYLVQVGSFERPAKVGLFLPDIDERQWHGSPSGRRGRTAQGVIVSLTETASGREIYRVTAVRTGRELAEDDLVPLVVAALQPLARDSIENP